MPLLTSSRLTSPLLTSSLLLGVFTLGASTALGAAPNAKAPSAKHAQRLARNFFAQAEEIHATSDEPDLPETPLLPTLPACLYKKQERISLQTGARFFPGKEFFVSACSPHSFAVISIDAKQAVKLVALEPHRRLFASTWDQDFDTDIAIASSSDARAFAAAWLKLKHRVDVSPRAIEVTATQDGYAVIASNKSCRYELSLSTHDGAHYGVGMHGTSGRCTVP